MRKAVGTDRRRRPERVLHVLQEMDADIVALQEADKRFGTRASAVPHGLIDSHGLYKPVEFGVSHSRLAHALPFGEQLETMLGLETRNLGWHGNAMLVKHEIEVTGVEALHLPTLEPRGAVLAELVVRGQRIAHHRHAPRPQRAVAAAAGAQHHRAYRASATGRCRRC